MKWNVRVADPEAVLKIARRLRPEDIAELWAASGKPTEIVLLESYTLSAGECWIADYNGDDILVFGVVSSDEAGIPWMLATPALENVSMGFLRGCKAWVEIITARHKKLRNYVDARNTVHIRWLRWMGFKFINLHDQWGFERRPFWEFIKEA